MILSFLKKTPNHGYSPKSISFNLRKQLRQESMYLPSTVQVTPGNLSPLGSPSNKSCKLLLLIRVIVLESGRPERQLQIAKIVFSPKRNLSQFSRQESIMQIVSSKQSICKLLPKHSLIV